MTKKLNRKSKLFLDKVNELKDITGFLNLHKSKANNIKGFKWIYSYHENGENRYISNMHLFVLKHIVISKNLPWEVIDKSQAKKSVNLEKSTYQFIDKGFGILFINLVDELYNPFNGFWHYKVNKCEFYGITLDELKNDVEKNNLPWVILNDEIALNSFNQNLTSNFESGIFRVNKITHEKFIGLFQWCYVYKENSGDYNFIICDDLNKLQDKICKKGLEWKITDGLKFNNAIEENDTNLKNIASRKWSLTGIYRVRKTKHERVSQGFLWVYRFRKNGLNVELSSTDLMELKQKVFEQDFDWVIVDEYLANNSLIENQENHERYGFSTNKNKTGIYRVYKNNNEKSKQGFYWCYSYSMDNKRTTIQSVNLLKLKEKVLSKGLEWIVIDKKLEEKSYKENEKNMKKYYD